jgi:hypothetical protein
MLIIGASHSSISAVKTRDLVAAYGELQVSSIPKTAPAAVAPTEKERKAWIKRELELECPRKNSAERMKQSQNPFDFYDYLSSTTVAAVGQQTRQPSSTREWESAGPMAKCKSSHERPTPRPTASNDKHDDIARYVRQVATAREGPFTTGGEILLSRKASEPNIKTRKDGHKRVPSSTREWEAAAPIVYATRGRSSAKTEEVPKYAMRPAGGQSWEAAETLPARYTHDKRAKSVERKVVAPRRTASSTREWETAAAISSRSMNTKAADSHGTLSRLRGYWAPKHTRTQSVEI